MDSNNKNKLLLEVLDLSLKKLQSGKLNVKQETQLQDALKKLGLNFEEAIRDAQKLLVRD